MAGPVPEKDFDRETELLKIELKGRQHRENVELYVRSALSVLLVALAAFLYNLAFSRDVDDVTIAASNAGTLTLSAVVAYWLNHIPRKG